MIGCWAKYQVHKIKKKLTLQKVNDAVRKEHQKLEGKRHVRSQQTQTVNPLPRTQKEQIYLIKTYKYWKQEHILLNVSTVTMLTKEKKNGHGGKYFPFIYKWQYL